MSVLGTDSQLYVIFIVKILFCKYIKNAQMCHICQYVFQYISMNKKCEVTKLRFFYTIDTFKYNYVLACYPYNKLHNLYV